MKSILLNSNDWCLYSEDTKTNLGTSQLSLDDLSIESVDETENHIPQMTPIRVEITETPPINTRWKGWINIFACCMRDEEDSSIIFQPLVNKTNTSVSTQSIQETRQNGAIKSSALKRARNSVDYMKEMMVHPLVLQKQVNGTPGTLLNVLNGNESAISLEAIDRKEPATVKTVSPQNIVTPDSEQDQIVDNPITSKGHGYLLKVKGYLDFEPSISESVEKSSTTDCPVVGLTVPPLEESIKGQVTHNIVTVKS